MKAGLSSGSAAATRQHSTIPSTPTSRMCRAYIVEQTSAENISTASPFAVEIIPLPSTRSEVAEVIVIVPETVAAVASM